MLLKQPNPYEVVKLKVKLWHFWFDFMAYQPSLVCRERIDK